MGKSITIVLCFIILCIGITSLTIAQGFEIECGEDVIIRNGVDIQFQNVDLTQHTVTTLSIGGYDPVMAVFNQQQNGGCNDDSTNTAGYMVDLPTTGVVSPSNLNSQMTFDNGSLMRVVIGEFDDLDGEVILMVEGLTFDGSPDRVDVTVTNDMVQAGIPLTAYAIEKMPGLDLSLAVVDDNGVPLLDERSQSVECDDAGDNSLCWGAHVSLIESIINISNRVETSGTAISPMLSIPLSAQDVGTIVPFQIKQSAEPTQSLTGEYIFLLHYGVGEVDVADGVASSITNPLGTTLSCGEEVILSDPIDVTIPRVDSQYTVSVLAKDLANPMLAIMNNTDGGICHIASPDGDQLFAELPILETFNRSVHNAHATIITEHARILTGLVDDASGSYLLAINGLNIPPDGTSDIVSVTVTESMVASGQPVSVFMISETLDLNPQLALVSADQQILTSADALPIVCTQTRAEDSCWGEFDDMALAQISLGEDNITFGVSNDVMLRIPLTTELIGTTLNFMGSGFDGTFGDYILILHLPSGVSLPTDS
jgi:hypothetical protein